MRQELWAITAYFNPVGYKRRLKNYHVFRRRLTAPLVAVELSFDGHFELADGDADILVQLHGGAIMWQKERLLNVALRHVPSECDALAWLDCDVVFENDDWVARAQQALEDMALVHLFQERHDLPADMDLDELATWNAETATFSVIQQLASGRIGPEVLSVNDALRRFRSTDGLAWAAQREVLEAHELYDAAIVGGGDKTIVSAAVDMPDLASVSRRMNAQRRAHYLAWARPFADTVQRRVGYLPGRIFHLWHGDLGDRGYTRRQELLADFDPFTDIALDAQGCWRWSSDKPELHAALRAYFASRREDGRSR